MGRADRRCTKSCYVLYSDEGLTSETSVSILSFLRCRIYIFITKLWLLCAIDMVKRAHQFCLFCYRCCRSKLVLCASNAGFAEAMTEANKTNKEIKFKKLKLELVPCCKWWRIQVVEGSALQHNPVP